MYIDESGFNIFTRRSKDRTPLGERVRRVVAPRERNVNITLAMSPDIGLVHHVIKQRTVTCDTFQAFINELLVILALRVPINEEVFIIFNGAQTHLNIVPPEFQDTGVCSMWSCCRHIAHFSTPSSKPIAAWRVQSNNIWCFLTFKLKFLTLKTCGQRLVSISSSGKPTCCFELGTTHFSKLHNRNVQTGARVFIGISLHLSIEKSFAIESDFINVNKYHCEINK